MGSFLENAWEWVENKAPDIGMAFDRSTQKRHALANEEEKQRLERIN